MNKLFTELKTKQNNHVKDLKKNKQKFCYSALIVTAILSVYLVVIWAVKPKDDYYSFYILACWGFSLKVLWDCYFDNEDNTLYLNKDELRSIGKKHPELETFIIENSDSELTMPIQKMLDYAKKKIEVGELL